MVRDLRIATLVLLLILLLSTLSSSALSNPYGEEPPPPVLIEQLQQQTEGKVRISYHAQTGKVRFIGTDLAHPIPRPATLAEQATPEQAARHFLSTYGRLFGLSDQANELTVMRAKSTDHGRSFVRFQQIYQGVPVMGGELIVQVDANKNILSANGELLPDPAVDLFPAIDAEAARQTALAKIAKEYDLSVADLTTTQPQLWIYNPILLGGPGLRFNSLVWRMDVEPRELLPIRELVLIDARLGAVALHFNQIATGRDRKTYTAGNTTNLPGTLVCDESNPTCSGGDSDAVAAHTYAGDTYDFYNTYHGRDSIDNSGMTIISTVHYGSGYANAFWSGSQMVYGDGYSAADDVVGHEMTHGVTQYESSLFYYYQSGSINEAFSDIWGEFVDLTNGHGDDTSGVRWLMGEDLPIGAIRDLSNPPAYSLPDKMTSTYYYCDEGDSGGVHYNMGVGSKAAYLLVDGGSFNGYTITGIGLEKTAKIFYEVQTNMFTSASDYADLYDALPQACLNLGYSTADCQEVQDAVDATEMNQQPTSCPATEAPVCDSGSPNNLFFDNLENTASGYWSSAADTGSDEWYYPQNSHPYTGFDATYATSGVYNLWGYAQGATADYHIAMTTDVSLPAGSTPYLHFNHAHGFEDYPVSGDSGYYDGGIVEYSTDGGSTWHDAGGLFTHNGYNGTIDLSGSSDNPLGGSQAFVGQSYGYYSSRANLSSLAGQSVRFRFRIGTDYSLDDYGWFIDDVRIYTCGAVSPTPTPTPTSTPTSTPSAYVYLPLAIKSYSPSPSWVTLVSDDFEGSFPGSWTVLDDVPGYGEYYWGKRDCRPYQGSYSGWGVGGGADGASLGCGSNYPNDTESWMIYGPFSLVGATAGDLQFKLWINTEAGYDYVCRFASIDGTSFYGSCTSGNSSGWIDKTLDLSDVYTLGNLMGQSQVWVALVSDSDSSITSSEGSYVDNVVLRKYVSSSGVAAPAVGVVESIPDGAQIVDSPTMMVRKE